MTLIYTYDEVGRFSGTENADLGLDGLPLVPNSATTLTPPGDIPSGEVPVFRDGWITLQDNIGTKYWLPDRSEHVQDVLGPLPDGAVLEMPPLTPEEELQVERARLNPPRMAFRSALHLLPSPTPDASMLEMITNLVENIRAITPFADIVRWHDDVVQILRLHPDMATVQSVAAANGLVLTDSHLDVMCRLGMLIDNGADQSELTDQITAWVSL